LLVVVAFVFGGPPRQNDPINPPACLFDVLMMIRNQLFINYWGKNEKQQQHTLNTRKFASCGGEDLDGQTDGRDFFFRIFVL